MLEVVHYYSTRCACMQHKSLVSSIDKLISRPFPHSGEQRHQLEVSPYFVSFLLFPPSLSTGHTSSQIINFPSSTFWYYSMWQSFLRGWGGSKGEWCIYSYNITQPPFSSPLISSSQGPLLSRLFWVCSWKPIIVACTVAFFGGRP